MILHISPIALKAGALAILFGVLATIFMRAFGRKFSGTFLPLSLGLLAACASMVAACFFNLPNLLAELGAILSWLTTEIKDIEVPILLITSLGLILFLLTKPLSERVAEQTYRSFYHASYGSLIAYLLYLSPEIAFFGISLSFLLSSILGYLRRAKNGGPLATFVENAMDTGLKEGEVRRYAATPLYLLGLMLVILFFPLYCALGGALMLVLGDPVAALVGSKYGEHRWTHKSEKSLEGSLAMFLVGILGLQMIGTQPLTAISVSAGATISESLSPGETDNIVIPLVSALIMNFI